MVPSGGILAPSGGTVALSGGILAPSSGNKQVIFIPVLSVFVMITHRKAEHGIHVFSTRLQPVINSPLGEERARARVWLSGGVLAQTWLLSSVPSTGVGEGWSPGVNSMLLLAMKIRKAISCLSH